MRKFGSLSALDSFNDEKSPWAIIFHGYGADAYDLFPLHQVFSTSKPLNWIFPQGPLEIPIGPGWTGRAWWNINVDRLQRDNMSNVDNDISKEVPPELPKAREKVLSMVEALKVPWENIILGGFSQGAMLAVDIFLHAPKNPKGLVVWSSALVNKDEWKLRAQSEEFKNRMKERPGFPFYQSHGTSDSVLTFKNGQRLEGFLQSLGMKGKLSAFPGAHEIPPQAIIGTRDYLNLVI